MLLGRRAMGSVAYMGGLPAVLETFTWCWGQMLQYNEEFLADDYHYVHSLRTTFSDHGPARNSLVANFLGDWLVQFDTDHVFEPDIVGRLLKIADTYDIDVLSGVYQLKNPPHVPVLYQWVQLGEERYGLQPLATWPEDAKVLQIGSAGAGCLFVRRKVFDILANSYKEGAFDKIYPYSEDHSFFLRCWEQKIKCYAAMQVHCHHLRITPVTMADMPKETMIVSDPFPVEGFK